MTLLERIQKEVLLLPPEKQGEALDFILFPASTQQNKAREKEFVAQTPCLRFMAREKY